jgi:hypothetical protein
MLRQVSTSSSTTRMLDIGVSTLRLLARFALGILYRA